MTELINGDCAKYSDVSIRTVGGEADQDEKATG